MKAILISGATSFIAESLARTYSDLGYQVIGISSSRESHPLYSKIIKTSLGMELPAHELDSFEIIRVLHCANAVGEDQYRLNYEGTILWASHLMNCGIKDQYLFSSISAISENDSSYAMSKKDLESWFLKSGLSILRFGLVIGRGGLAFKMYNMVKKLPVLPLLGGGVSLTYVTGISDIQRYFIQLEKNEVDNSLPINLFNQKCVKLKELLKAFKKNTSSRCLLIPVPVKPVYYAVKLLEVFKINFLPISSVTLKGLLVNGVVSENSSLSLLKIDELDLQSMVDSNIGRRS